MDDLSFTTFLKLALMSSTQQRLTELQRMHAGDRGYDFYKQMKFAAKEVALGEVEPTEIMNSLKSIKRASEREHNIKMAENFMHWWKSQPDAKALAARPQGIYKTEGMRFGIKLRPELAYKQNDSIHIVYLWATQSPKMTNQVAGTGLQILRETLAKSKFKDATFSILNLRTGKLLEENLISNQSKVIAAAEISGLNELWKSLT